MSLHIQHNNEYWLNSFRSGNEEGFNYFFRLYYKPLCFFARRYLSDPAVAEEVASDVFVQLWERRETIESEAHLRNYLYKGIYHLCLDHLGKTKTRQKHLANMIQATEAQEEEFTDNMVRSETLNYLEHSISLLPPQCELVFRKMYIEGKTVKETASELGLTISTINNQKARGIKLLRSRLTISIVLLFYLPLLGF